MGDPKAFLRIGRTPPSRRPVAERLGDWREVYEPLAPAALSEQASRCMACGIPFCHEGCPLGNLIPEWNDLVVAGRLDDAAERLAATNNFPEFTGRLCPAPCEGSCVLGIASEPVLIKQVELEIAEHAASAGLEPRRPPRLSGRSVAVVGSGPAGLAAAQQLTRAGHRVVVFERAERPGGLLRYGIPGFKMEKSVLDRRLAQMEAEGTEFRTGVAVGGSSGEPGTAAASAPGAEVVDAGELRAGFDALVLAVGATAPRDLDVPGRELSSVHFAMDYLKGANLVLEGGLDRAPVDAAGRDVVIVGGGDTGADCLGTALRQGAASVVQLEIMPAPPLERAADNPWPTWPVVLRTSSAHEEGGTRLFSLSTTAFLGDGEGRVRALALSEVRRESADGRTVLVPVEDSACEVPAGLVLLALGFGGPERGGLVAGLGLRLDRRGNIEVGPRFETSEPGVFCCGDAARGQSLVVWAIAEGRAAAAAVDRHLRGTTGLGAPVVPGQLALS